VAGLLFGNFIDRVMGDISKWPDDTLSANCQCLPNAFAGGNGQPPEPVNLILSDCQCLPNA